MTEIDMTEKSETLTAKLVLISDRTRDFFTNILPDTIPDDAHAIALSPEGYVFFSEVEFNEWKEEVRKNAGGGVFIFPRSMFFSYYEYTYES